MPLASSPAVAAAVGAVAGAGVTLAVVRWEQRQDRTPPLPSEEGSGGASATIPSSRNDPENQTPRMRGSRTPVSCASAGTPQSADTEDQ